MSRIFCRKTHKSTPKECLRSEREQQQHSTVTLKYPTRGGGLFRNEAPACFQAQTRAPPAQLVFCSMMPACSLSPGLFTFLLASFRAHLCPGLISKCKKSGGSEAGGRARAPRFKWALAPFTHGGGGCERSQKCVFTFTTCFPKPSGRQLRFTLFKKKNKKNERNCNFSKRETRSSWSWKTPNGLSTFQA